MRKRSLVLDGNFGQAIQGKSNLSGWRSRYLLCLLMGLLFAWPAGGLWAQETVTIEPAGRASWDQIVQADAARRAAGEPQPPVVVPFMSMPGPREIGSTPVGPLAPAETVPTPGGEPTTLGPVLNKNFQSLLDNYTTIPPDTMGAAGPNHLMTMLNSEVLIQDKNGGTVLGPVSLSAFWSLLAGDPFDPRLVYDSIHGRWIATCDADSYSVTSRVFFAISDTSDPTGFWTYYSIVADGTGTTWADFPGFGVNTTWIAITNNMYDMVGFGIGAKMWVIDKATALVPGGPITLTIFGTSFDYEPVYGTDGFSLQPCVTFGPEPKLYIADNSSWNVSGAFLMRMSEITGTGPAPIWSVTPGSSYAGTGLFFVVNNFDWGQIDASQLGTATRVETNDPRICSNSYFRNGRIWCSHSAGLPAGGPVDRTAVFWYQFDPATMAASGAPIVQSGVLDGGADVHHFFPSISANMNDDACLGFSRSHAGIYVEGVYTSRFGTDPAGTMDPITVLKAGEDSYVKIYGGTRVRWGDYSATMVDPVDDESFWTIQEYAVLDIGPTASNDRWGTWWGGVKETVTLGEIHGFKWDDINGDGVWDKDVEPPLGGWKIYLDPNENCKWDSEEPFYITEPNGVYHFTGLDPNTYIVAEVIEPNCLQTYPGDAAGPLMKAALSTRADDLTPAESAGCPGTHTITLGPGEKRENVNFGNHCPACGDWGYFRGDLNFDCYVNLKDLAIFALDWLLCSHPDDPECQLATP